MSIERSSGRITAVQQPRVSDREEHECADDDLAESHAPAEQLQQVAPASLAEIAAAMAEYVVGSSQWNYRVHAQDFVSVYSHLITTLWKRRSLMSEPPLDIELRVLARDVWPLLWRDIAGLSPSAVSLLQASPPQYEANAAALAWQAFVTAVRFYSRFIDAAVRYDGGVAVAQRSSA